MRRRIRRTTIAPPAAVVTAAVSLLMATLACSGCASSAIGTPDKGFVEGPGTISAYPPGSRATPGKVTGTTLDGTPIDLASYRGAVTVVNVWGSWCTPCRAEAPALERVYTADRSRGVRFLGLNVKERDRAAPVAFTRAFGVTYPSIHSTDGRVLLAFPGIISPSSIPSTLVLDRRGRVAVRVLGGVTERSLQTLVEGVLAERAA